jgi:radical SAM superfamily enzyme YgiQ (UPF0313 family)
MYKDVKFKKRPVDAVKADIDTAKVFTDGKVKTVFIGDSDSLVVKTAEIGEILGYLHQAFPSLDRVTSYARAQTLRRKALESLRKTRRAGLTRLHIGLETGSAFLLDRIKKGAGPGTMVEACTKAKAAGFEVSLYVLLGIGGEEHWREHASETAKVLNQIDPDFVRVRTLVPQPGTPVYQWWKEGSFEMASPETVLREQQTLVQGLSIRSRYLSDHVSNYAPINGDLPDDKRKMLAGMDEALEMLSKDKGFRAELENMRLLRRL